MTDADFYRIFSLTLLVSIGATLMMISWAPLSAFSDFAVIALIFFTSINLMVYYVGKYTATNPNKNLFTYFSMFVILLKLLAALLLVIIYQKLVSPETNYFIIIFAVLYLIHTIAEVIMLMRLSKMNI